MSVSREQIVGIVGHAKEVIEAWHEAYKEAVAKDDGEAIQALLKVANKLKRAKMAAQRVYTHADDYLAAEKAMESKIISTGDLDQDLDFAALKASSVRKVHSLDKFIKEVETL